MYVMSKQLQVRNVHRAITILIVLGITTVTIYNQFLTLIFSRTEVEVAMYTYEI